MLDALIIGAGPAGAAAALTLRAAGRSVEVWDHTPLPVRKVGESLPAAAMPLLRDLGVSDILSAGHHARHPGHQVIWESEALRRVEGIRDPQGLGWHLDRPQFERQLREAVAARGVAILPRHCASLDRDQDAWKVTDRKGQQVGARMLVEATGRRASIARLLGVRRQRDTDLVALVQWCKDISKDRHTMIEAVDYGWWYAAPVARRERVVVLHTSPELAVSLRQEFTNKLRSTQIISGPVGDPITKVSVRDATGGRLDQIGGPGWLAVGDAGMCFEPLSSQGLFHALYTGLRGGQALDAALNGDPEPGITYGKVLSAVRQRYIQQRMHMIQSVRRWPRSSFWQSHFPSSSSFPVASSL